MTLLENKKLSLCSDPRDRIFALLSFLPDDEKGLAIEPNNNKTTHEILQEFVTHYIKSRNHLQILTTIEMRHEVQDDWPSWVPNWSVARKTTRLSSVMASGLSNPNLSFEGKLLRITGTTIGTIHTVEPFGHMDTTVNAMEELRRIIHKMNLQDFLFQGSTNIHDFCRVLFGNDFSDFFLPPRQDFLRIARAEEALREALLFFEQKIENPQWDLLFSDHVLFHCQDRTLFRCLDGALGLAPYEAREGDKVVVWLGCKSAMVLLRLTVIIKW